MTEYFRVYFRCLQTSLFDVNYIDINTLEMPRTYEHHPICHWTDVALNHALQEHKVAGTSIRDLSKKCSVPKSTVQRHIKKGGKSKVGRRTVFKNEEEIELKECIVKLAELGFPLTLKDIGELVESFVSVNRIEHAKNIFKFGGRPGHPGPDWMNSFIKQNNLSLKEATKSIVPRYNATKNPFIIYHYYDILEETIDRLNLRNRLFFSKN